MGWAVLVFLAAGAGLIGLGSRAERNAAVADDRIGAAFLSIIGFACLGLAILLWVLWISFR